MSSFVPPARPRQPIVPLTDTLVYDGYHEPMQMLRVGLTCLYAAAVFVALSPAASGQATPPPAELPEAPGKAVALKVCSSCHGVEILLDPPRTVASWIDTMYLMKDFGAAASEADWKTTTDYLIANLAHLEVNKASGEEMAALFGLDEKAAAAVIAYRDKQGGFKTIDDLKKAPGLDAAKVEAMKPRLMF
jgi:competence protein ComEA